MIEAKEEKNDREYFDFTEALKKLKSGSAVRRKGWYPFKIVVCQKGYPDGVPCNLNTAEVWGITEGSTIVVNPYFQIRNDDMSCSIYLPSTDDLLAEDWYESVR